MFLRIPADTIPEKKKTAVGVRGIRLAEGDKVVHMYRLSDVSGQVAVDHEGAEVVLNRLRIGNRDTKGVQK